MMKACTWQGDYFLRGRYPMRVVIISQTQAAFVWEGWDFESVRKGVLEGHKDVPVVKNVDVGVPLKSFIVRSEAG